VSLAPPPSSNCIVKLKLPVTLSPIACKRPLAVMLKFPDSFPEIILQNKSIFLSPGFWLTEPFLPVN
jgi:hypothetical protein